MLLRLGNDVVDLSLPEVAQKYLDQRFLLRVFTPTEQNAILTSRDKSKIIWSLWAAKEAAYKACQKQFPEIIFSPKKLMITDETLFLLKTRIEWRELTGGLIYQGLFISLKWHWQQDAVHCLAVLLENQEVFQYWQEIHWKITKINCSVAEESYHTRLFAKQFLQTFGLDPTIEIIRPIKVERQTTRLGPPVLSNGKETITNYEISLSHDGHWAAVAMGPSFL